MMIRNLSNIRRPRLTRAAAAAPVAPERLSPDIQRREAFGLTWVHIQSPGELEAGWLSERYDFHPLDLEDVRSRRRQRAKIDVYDEYAFVVLHFPRFDKRTGRLQPAEMNAFVADGFVITITKEPLKALNGLFARARNEDEAQRLMSHGSGYLFYEIVDALVDYCFPILDKIGFKLDSIEDEMFAGTHEALVRDVAQARQEIIGYRKIVKPQRPTLRQLERPLQRYAPRDLELYFDDIVDKNERIWDLLESHKELIDSLAATNEAIITHRLNEIVRALTVLSAVVLPLTLIAGIWGMNVDYLPLASAGTPWSLLFPVALMVGCAAVLLGWFRHKRWL